MFTTMMPTGHLPFNNCIGNFLTSQTSAATTSEPPVSIELENSDLWRQFNHVGSNEMILTKSGRRMFPTLRYKVSGMDPNGQYAVMLEFVPVDSCRYRFVNGEWSVSGRGDHTVNEATSQLRIYAHPDSPAPGRLWMKSSISFHKVKLTNNLPSDPRGHVLLHSMHKYLPRVHVVRLHDFYPVPRLVACYSCPETSFIAVTAYQNEKVIQLKIDHNPFAKGFRESDKKGAKRDSTEEPTGLKTPEDHHHHHTQVAADRQVTKRPRTTSSTTSDDTFESTSSAGSFASISPPLEQRDNVASPLDLSVKSGVKTESHQFFHPNAAAVSSPMLEAYRQMQLGFNPFAGPFQSPMMNDFPAGLHLPFGANFLAATGQMCPPTPPYRHQLPCYPGMQEQAEFLRQQMLISAMTSFYDHNRN